MELNKADLAGIVYDQTQDFDYGPSIMPQMHADQNFQLPINKVVSYVSVYVMFAFSFAGFFIPGFPKLIRYQEHHEVILKKFLPKVKKNMVS